MKRWEPLKWLKYLFWGVSWGCIFFLGTCLVGYWTAGEKFLLPIVRDFPRQVLGAVLAGIACGSSAVVYTCDRLPFWAQVLIHFAIGLGGFYPTALWLRWIPRHAGWSTVLSMLISVAVFFTIWLCFYLYNRLEAKCINRRLRGMEHCPEEKK